MLSDVFQFSSVAQLCPTICSIRVFSSESVLHIRGPEYWSFSFSVSPSNDWILEGQCLGIRNVSVGIKNANLEFGELEGQFS